MKEMKDLSFYEILTYGTTRIQCISKNGSQSTGTGFFLYLNDFENPNEEPRPVIVTNKHVVRNADKGFLTLSTLKGNKIQETKHVQLPLSNFESYWIDHPDNSVDLCILNFNAIETLIRGSMGIELFYMPLLITMIPTEDSIKQFDAMEDVVMVGYPNGIWDSHNNKPIFRKGITATDYRIDYENRSEFLIDMAVFGGSSGSPVIYAWKGLKMKNGELYEHRDLQLLGICYAVFQHSAKGELKTVEIPQAEKQTVVTGVPNNLGLVIKSGQLHDFRKMFFS